MGIRFKASLPVVTALLCAAALPARAQESGDEWAAPPFPTRELPDAPAPPQDPPDSAPGDQAPPPPPDSSAAGNSRAEGDSWDLSEPGESWQPPPPPPPLPLHNVFGAHAL